ncbi:MAG: DUF87 domain-containing protein [Verrucomicrobium sp.]|nr:DUF87 domain-containing protein [Verrucomicrobium sp.]
MKNGFRWPKFGMVPAARFIDPVQLASPLDVVGTALLDAYGGVHEMYELQAPTTDVFSPSRLNDLQDSLSTLVTRLPEGIDEIEFTFTTNGDYTPVIRNHAALRHENPVLDELRRTRAGRLQEEVRKGKLVACATHITVGSVAMARQGVKDLRRPVDEAEFRVVSNRLRLAEESLRAVTDRSGMVLNKLESPAMAEYFYRLLNPEQAVDMGIPPRFDAERTPWIDAWLCQPIDTAPMGPEGPLQGMIRWGDYYHAVISMSGKPLETQPRIMDVVTAALPFRQCRATFRVRRLDQLQEKDLLVKARDKADQIRTMPLNFLDRAMNPYGKDRDSGANNVEANEQIREANELIAKIRTGEEILVQTQLIFHLWHRDPQELQQRCSTLQVRMAEVGNARGYHEKDGILPILFGSLPAAGGPMLEPKKISSRMAADMIPLNRGFETQDRPVAMFANATGGIVPINLFDTSRVTAPMAFVSGKSGSGKSVTVNHLIASHALADTRVIILDVGGSYDSLAEILGAKVFRLDPQRPACLNIFQVLGQSGDSISAAVSEPKSALRSRFVNALEALCTRPEDPNGCLPSELRTVVDVGVAQTFAWGAERRKPYITLSDFTERVSKFAEGKKIAERIRPFLKNELWGQWFDGPTEWNVDSKAFIVDLRGIKKQKQLADALIPLIVSLIDDLCVRDKDVPKILVFEEMWEHVGNPKVMDMVIDSFKTFRKLGAAVIGVSQAMGDLLENARMAKAVVQNAQTWFLLDQGDGDNRKIVAEQLKLTLGEQEVLRTLSSSRRITDDGKPEMFREMLFVRGSGEQRESGRLRTSLMPEDLWLHTTTGREMALREHAMKAAGGDRWLAVKGLALKYPLGLDPREAGQAIEGEASPSEGA